MDSSIGGQKLRTRKMSVFLSLLQESYYCSRSQFSHKTLISFFLLISTTMTKCIVSKQGMDIVGKHVRSVTSLFGASTHVSPL